MARPVILVAVQIVVVIAILACLATVVARHPARLDLTPDRRFTLSPHTRQVLERLEGPVRITAFYSSQQSAERRDMNDLFALYTDSPKITVRMLDLDRSPGAAQRLGISSYNVAVIEAGERRQRIDPVTEDTVTAALLAVAGTPPVSTYFIVGHGERDPRESDPRAGGSDAARALRADGFELRVLEGGARIPDDAGLIVLAGARRDLAPAEIDAIASYVRRGGRAIVLSGQETPPSVRKLLAEFGVELGHDVVVDEQSRLFGTDGLSARVAYLNESLVPAAPDAHALLPLAQTVRLVDAPGVSGDYMATTAEQTWADVDRRALDGAADFRPGVDRHGPLPVAAHVRTRSGDREGRLVVIGDADFLTNLHVNVLGNRDLLLAAAELVARDDPLAAARPPALPGGTFSPLALTAHEARLIFWSAVVAPSAAFAAAAILMSLRRRRLA